MGALSSSVSFLRSPAGAFHRSPGNVRRKGLSYTSFRMVVAFAPICGLGPYEATTNPLSSLVNKRVWPTVYTIQTQTWYYPSWVDGGGVTHPATSGITVFDYTLSNSCFKDLFAGGVTGSDGLNDFNIVKITNTGSTFGSPYDPPDSVTSSDTQASATWTIKNADGSTAGTATFLSVLSAPVSFDTVAIACRALLDATPIPTGDDVCMYVYPGASGTVTVLKSGTDCTVLLAAKAVPVAASVNTYGVWGGTGLAPVSPSLISLLSGASLDNFPWPAVAGMPTDLGAVMFAKSQWNLLPIPPTISGIYPPTDADVSEFFRSTPLAQSFGYNPAFQNPIVNAYLLNWVLAGTLANPGDKTFTIGAPASFLTLPTPASFTFGPDDVPGLYGEIGLRSSIQ